MTGSITEPDISVANFQKEYSLGLQITIFDEKIEVKNVPAKLVSNYSGTIKVVQAPRSFFASLFVILLCLYSSHTSHLFSASSLTSHHVQAAFVSQPVSLAGGAALLKRKTEGCQALLHDSA
jgi:hypothetical protein